MIAVSYRRDDSMSATGRLCDRLQSEFGKDNVFRDFDSIPYGVDFRKHIQKTLEKAEVVVVIIGPDWFGKTEKSGRRIDDPADFVRLEIAGALQRDIPIIPVLIGNTKMPAAESLPAEIESFAFRNGLALDPGIDFHPHADRLIAGIRKVVKPAAPIASANQEEIEASGRHSKRIWIAGTMVLVLALAIAAAWYFSVGHRNETLVRSSSPAQSPSPGSINPLPAASVQQGTVPTASEKNPSVPLERYQELKGKWLIIEQVNKDHGGEEIAWSYEATVTGGQLSMRGTKTAVNEAGSSSARELGAGEKATVSIYSLKLDGLQADGTSDEQDPNGHIYSTLKIQFSDDLKSLSGTFMTGGADVSKLYGSKQ